MEEIYIMAGKIESGIFVPNQYSLRNAGVATIKGRDYRAYRNGHGLVHVVEIQKFLNDKKKDIEQETRKRINNILQSGSLWTLQIEEDEGNITAAKVFIEASETILEFNDPVSAAEAKRYLRTIEIMDDLDILTIRHNDNHIGLINDLQMDDAQQFEDRWN